MGRQSSKGSPYNIIIKVREDKLTQAEIEKRVSDFQSVFINVASRYYSEKMKGEHE